MGCCSPVCSRQHSGGIKDDREARCNGSAEWENGDRGAGSRDLSSADVRHTCFGSTSITHRLLTPSFDSLERRISKVPFPPGTKSLHFNLETILDSNVSSTLADRTFNRLTHIQQALDSQLTPATHAVGLLKAEVAREDRSLAAETKILKDLKTNARAEDSLRRKRAKNVSVDRVVLLCFFPLTTQRSTSWLERALNPNLTISMPMM